MAAHPDGHFLTAISVLPAQEPSDSSAAWRDLDTQEWLEDLDYLAGHLRRLHANPFHAVSEQQSDATVATLRQKIPTLGDAAVVVELARLVASVGDGHTRVSPSANIRGVQYPLQLRAFPRGLYVVASPPESPRVRGARLVAIGGAPVEEVRKAARGITSADNDVNCRDRMTENLVYDSLGEAYLEAGNTEAALKAYREALQRDPHLWSSVLAVERLEHAER